KYLGSLEFSCDVDAIPEGRFVFPHEPLVRITGPLLQAQIIETPLLNILNFQTLIASKASRVVSACEGDPVLEFGLRRAQGVDGALAASRAAYLGGCAATSNVLAGKRFGIPVKGTHAHAWVMAFDTEKEAFEAYADAMPNNCVFLVDTYDTVEGVKRAIEVGHELRKRGAEMVGVRLDSGDLAELSIAARNLLDEAGFPDAQVVASNDLDEHVVTSLKQQGARVGVWGIGTKLVTAFDQPALGGVYKLAGVQNEDGSWDYKVKLSEQAIKISTPGIQQVRRYMQDGEPVGDVLFEEQLGLDDAGECVDINDYQRPRKLAGLGHIDLLEPIFRAGKLVYDIPTLEQSRALAAEERAAFPRTMLRPLNPQLYGVNLDKRLFELKSRLVREARGHQ
ncbi:MAG: nicotinate phosphoribosyltransferase, partial [Myxococcales bacterium]|nr:nicotinate phosphoribosyltransferase [Myxococcales bacterium]